MAVKKPTKEQRKKIKEAAIHLNAKLKLEKELTNKIRKFLKRQSNSFLEEWKKSGRVLNAQEFSEELSKILTNHYSKSAGKFAPGIVNQINTALEERGFDAISSNDPAIISSLLAFIQSNVAISTQKITETSNNEMATYLEIEDGDGVKAAKKLKQRALPRSVSIGATETQKAVEGAKSTTMDTAEDVATSGAIALLVFSNTKTWMPRFDGRVRPEHDLARFQEVLTRQSFLVGGEELMFPGDMSLGASLWNVINCRCTLIYSVRIL